jgi:hypothetical protein
MENVEEKVNQRSQPVHHDTWKIVVVALCSLLVLVIVFGAGMLAGLEKAEFSQHWQTGYYPRMVLNAHGVAGPVIRVNQDSLVIEDRDGSEKTALVSPDTTIKEDGNTIGISQVKLNDQVVVIGSPDDQGEVKASIIRVMDDGTPTPTVPAK